MDSVMRRISKDLESVLKSTKRNVKQTLGTNISLTKASKVIASVIKGQTVKVTIHPKKNVKETIEFKF